jgi:hypothetical protein
MKDRAGLGRVFAYKGTITSVNKPKGGVFENVEILPGHDFPKETQGVPPGEWLQAEVAQNDNDLDRVGPARGVARAGARRRLAYSAFALLAEQDDRRVGPGAQAHPARAREAREGLRRRHAHVLAAGQAIVTCRRRRPRRPARLVPVRLVAAPVDVYVKVGKGAPLPQSQAAEAQKIFDVFDRGISSGQVQPIDWLYDSLQAGKMLPLPKKEPQMQLDSADLENNLMAHGTPVQVRPYDDDELHVQRHRLVQEALSMVPGMEQIVAIVEQHIQEHLQNAQAKQQQQVGMQNGNGPNAAGFGAQGAAMSERRESVAGPRRRRPRPREAPDGAPLLEPALAGAAEHARGMSTQRPTDA